MSKALASTIERAKAENVGPQNYLIQVIEGSTVTFVGPCTEAHSIYLLENKYKDKVALKILMEKPRSVWDPPELNIEQYGDLLNVQDS